MLIPWTFGPKEELSYAILGEAESKQSLSKEIAHTSASPFHANATRLVCAELYGPGYCIRHSLCISWWDSWIMHEFHTHGYKCMCQTHTVHTHTLHTHSTNTQSHAHVTHSQLCVHEVCMYSWCNTHSVQTTVHYAELLRHALIWVDLTFRGSLIGWKWGRVWGCVSSWIFRMPSLCKFCQLMF